MAWNDLSMSDKSRMMRLAINSGITDLRTIRDVYNSYAEGGPVKNYKNWKEQIERYKGINTDDPDYDYEGFYNENPIRAWQMLEDNPKAHFTDKYKTESHPTLSNESIYANGRGGTWGEGTFELSDYLMQNSDRTLDYLRRNDPDIIPTYQGGIVLNSAGITDSFAEGGKIHIKPENRGKFTELKKRTGHSASWFKENGTPAQRKMATFALNARKWHHADGGYLFALGGNEEESNGFFRGLLNTIRNIPTKKYKTDTFGEAFRQARNDGHKNFVWNGNRYNTELWPTYLQKDEKLNIQGLSKQQLKAMEDTWNYFRSQNISARNAAAVMGNMMQESSFNPNVVQKGGDSAVGYFQMHGQRLKDYYTYLEEIGAVDSPERQIDYMIDVMRNKRKDFYMDEYYRIKNSVNKIMEKPKPSSQEQDTVKYFNNVYGKREAENRLYPIKDFSEAFEDESIPLNDLTDMFTNTIERAGKPEYEKRRSYANSIYNYFYGVPTRVPSENNLK